MMFVNLRCAALGAFAAAGVAAGAIVYNRDTVIREGGEALSNWQRTAQVQATGCWHKSLERLDELSLDCAQHDDQARSLLALSITQCNFAYNPKEFPDQEDAAVREATGCDIDKAFQRRQERSRLLAQAKETDESSGALAEADAYIQGVLRSCKSAMTGAAISSLVEVTNHLDSVCFFMHSELWQQRTEQSFVRVVDQLTMLDHKHFELLAQADHLKSNLQTGNEHLQIAFGEMREQVNQESRKILSLFDETFSVVNRVLQFQKTIMGRLAGFETLFVYALLIVVSFYMTGAESTRQARPSIFAVWTAMSIAELLLRKYFHAGLAWAEARWPAAMDTVLHRLGRTDDPLTQVLRWCRCGCAAIACGLWFRAFWTYRNPTLVLVQAVEDLKEQVRAIREDSTVEDYGPLVGSSGGNSSTAQKSSHPVNPLLWQRRHHRRVSDLAANIATAAVRSNAFNEMDDDDDDDDDDDVSVGLSESSEDSAASGDTSSSSISLAEESADEDALLAGTVGDAQGEQRWLRDEEDGNNHHNCTDNNNSKRRNPRRSARPRSYRAPTSIADVHYLRLNPVLLLETPNDFTALFEQKNRERMAAEQQRRRLIGCCEVVEQPCEEALKAGATPAQPMAAAGVHPDPSPVVGGTAAAVAATPAPAAVKKNAVRRRRQPAQRSGSTTSRPTTADSSVVTAASDSPVLIAPRRAIRTRRMVKAELE